MMNLSESRKLETLRSKTDRQLVALIERKLDAGMRCASMGGEFRMRAERTYADARLLVPWTSGADRRRLELKMQQLRECLDAVPACVLACVC